MTAPGGDGRASTPLGLHTDLYEIRMVESYLLHDRLGPATFSLFSRPTPERPWLVSAGLDRVLEVVDDFRFGDDELAYLSGQDTPGEVLDWLAEFRFEGEIWAVPDGTLVLGEEPLLEVTAPLPVAQLLETVLMNAVHYDTLVATKAARCVLAAEGRPVVDFGFRRAHGLEAGNRAARAAWLGGCAATSNVEAGRRYGIPITGTMAHSFIQSFDHEVDAYRAFARDHPGNATLLVDTYEVEQGIDNAIAVAQELAEEGIGIPAIRIDSEPLDELSRHARSRLDEAGLEDVRILVSGGLDEFAIAELVTDDAPVDGFGVGSALVTSGDKPALDVAYKLVEYAGRGRAKYSPGKRFLPGAKQVFRSGGPEADVLERRDAVAEGRPLLQQVWKGTEAVHEPELEAARERVAAQLEDLPERWREPRWEGEPPTPRIGPELDTHAEQVRKAELGPRSGAAGG